MVKYVSMYAGTLALALLGLSPITSHAYELQVNAGVSVYSVTLLSGDSLVNKETNSGEGGVLGFSVKAPRGMSGKHYWGVGLDIADIEGDLLLGYRAVDYQYAMTDTFRVGAFLGAASWDTGLPQNGYYFGLNASMENVFPRVGLKLEARVADGLARDTILDSDPKGEITPDIFADIHSVVASVTYRF